MVDQDAPRPLCPSAPARPGAVLLGVIAPGGRVAYLPERQVVDREMLAELAADGPVDENYRLASPCMTSSCLHWAESRCHVPDLVRLRREQAGLPSIEDALHLPACSIRSACRWWLQDGPSACALCPLVATKATAAAR